MVFSILNKENIFSKYEAAKSYTEKLSDPFPEFERIARNRPKDTIPGEYPNTTDGTTASIIKKTPRRIIQQLPSGSVEVVEDNENAYLPLVAEYIYTNKILPHANSDYDLVQKCWGAIESGLTVGAAAVVTPFLSRDGVFSTDMLPIHWGNVAFQPGKRSGYSCDYVFIRQWWQSEDIDTLIHREKKLQKEAKANGEEYDSSWDIAALKEIKDAKTLKDQQGETPIEKERNAETEAISIVTGYQVGVDAEFITFSPDTKKIIRVKKNKDPRGRMPVDFFYADTDGANPWGRGIVEVIGGMQNLLDSEIQMYQYNRALQLNPPLIKRGTFNKTKIKFQPNAIIDLGDDANASIDPLTIDSHALNNFGDHYSLMKSQIYNLTNANGDSSISSTVGDINSSKTPAGVKQAQEMISIDDNFLRRMFEAFFENWSETAINLYFAEREGQEVLQLDEKTAEQIRALVQKGRAPEGIINERNEVIIDYSEASGALKFRVDATSSKKKSDAEQAEAIGILLERAEASPILSQLVPQEKFAAAWNSLVSASGIEDPEKLSIDLKELEEQQAMQEQMMQEQMAQEQMMQDQAMQGQAQGIPERLEGAIPGEVVEPTTEAQMIEEQLRGLGVSDMNIQEALQMASEGVAAEEIMAALFGGVNG